MITRTENINAVIIKLICAARFVSTSNDAALHKIIFIKIFSIATENGIVPTTCDADNNKHNRMPCPND